MSKPHVNVGTFGRDLKPIAQAVLAAARGSDAGVESETCSDCDRGYVPAWDGEGNEIGEQPCQRCGGTGSIEKAKPQPNKKVSDGLGNVASTTP